MSTPENDQLLNGCPECGGVIDVGDVRPFEKILCPYCSKAIRVRTNFNNFTIVSEIGEGGMSRVFRAHDNTLGREVALKILHSHFGDKPERLAQFEREARITASITHPNVVQVYTVGRDQGYFYIAMELLDGESLDQLIHRQGNVNEITGLRMIHDVALGLAEAHENGLIHRDIKPGNILIDSQGTAKLVDFGLALVQGDDEDHTGEIWATPYYVPPEKLRRRKEDFRSDIYSLGATLYHLLAGRPPHDVATNSVEELITLKSRPVDLGGAAPNLTANTVDLVHRMMARQPDQRYTSYRELLGAISHVRSVVDPNFTARSNRGGVPVWTKVLGGALGLAMVGGAAFYLLQMNQAEQTEFGEDDNINFGEAEIVVSTADLSFKNDFVKAQETMAGGDLNQAAKLFLVIAETERARADVKAWSYFHLGLIHLFLGDLEKAMAVYTVMREPLADIKESDDQAFLTQCANYMAPEGEVATKAVEGGSYAPLAGLVYGLKDWHLGEFKASAKLFDHYSKDESNEWWQGYADLAKPYLEDARLIAKLPDPAQNGVTADALEAMVKDLETRAGKAQTEGARTAIAKRKSDAVARLEIVTMEMQAKKIEAARKQLALVQETLADLAARRAFDEGDELLASIEPSGEEMIRQTEQLTEVWSSARIFFTAFVEKLGSYRYEGEILRADPSKPAFRAKVSGIRDNMILVDLGFGDTPMNLNEISSEGLLKIASATVLTDGEAEVREGGAFFAYLIGEKDQAARMAEGLRGVAGFSAKWNALTSAPQS